MDQNNHADEIGQDVDPRRVVLTDGTVLRVQPVPPLLLDRLVNQRFKAPAPPTIRVKAFDGERDEPNPNDPAYQETLRSIEEQRKQAIVDLFLLRGVVDVEMPTHEEWTADLAELQIEIGESSAQRRLAYLKYVLLATAADLERVMAAITRLSGVTEADIAEAEARFRRNGHGPVTGDGGQGPAEVADQLPTGV